MKFKKWILLFLASLIVLCLLYAAFNMITDPFGVFGDKLFDYYEYNITENPRVAKIAYLEENHDKYDSYIIGCSKTSSYPIEDLNKYFDASFYNAFVYGGDMQDEELIAKHIIKNYENVKNIVIAMGPEAAYKYGFEEDSLKDNLHCILDDSSQIAFYAKYAFLHPSYSFNKIKSYMNRGYIVDSTEVFNAETGAYNKQTRDSSRISDLDEYLALEGVDFNITHSRPLKYIDECVKSVLRIKKLCEEAGINFVLIASPMYETELECYAPDEMARLWRELADVTDFYDFWGYNEISGDERYYYDPYHFRNDVGHMALAYMFSDKSVYIPDNFGNYTTKENVEDRINDALSREEIDKGSYSVKVPILMYHSFDESESDDYGTIAADKFEEQLKSLKEAGYNAVFYKDVIEYVDSGKALPENPILITFDDGYLDNIEIAYPLLEKYDMRATVAIVGVTEGKEVYKDTGAAINPHFSLDDETVIESYNKGVLDYQTHSFDMHQVEKYDGEGCRKGAVIFDSESEDDYISALKDDFNKSNERIKSAVGSDTTVYTYPYGAYSVLSEVVLHSLGVRATTTTDYGINEIIKGVPQSLYLLKRMNVTGDITGDALVNTLNGLKNG